MSDDAHTPGPWIPVQDEDRPWDGKTTRFVGLQDVSGEDIINGCGECGSPFIERPADLRLMASAPDLLAERDSLRLALSKAQERILAADDWREKATTALRSGIDRLREDGHGYRSDRKPDDCDGCDGAPHCSFCAVVDEAEKVLGLCPSCAGSGLTSGPGEWNADRTAAFYSTSKCEPCNGTGKVSKP